MPERGIVLNANASIRILHVNKTINIIAEIIHVKNEACECSGQSRSAHAQATKPRSGEARRAHTALAQSNQSAAAHDRENAKTENTAPRKAAIRANPTCSRASPCAPCSRPTPGPGVTIGHQTPTEAYLPRVFNASPFCLHPEAERGSEQVSALSACCVVLSAARTPRFSLELADEVHHSRCCVVVVDNARRARTCRSSQSRLNAPM